MAHGDIRGDAFPVDCSVPAGLQSVGDLGRKPDGSRTPPDKLIDTTFSAADFRAETRSLAEVSLWSNYRVWGGVLLVLCVLILIIFR